MGFGEVLGATLSLLPGSYRLTFLFPFLLTELFQLSVLMPRAHPWSSSGEMWSGGGWVTPLRLGLAGSRVLHPWLGVGCWWRLRWGGWDAGPAGPRRVTLHPAWAPDGPSVCSVPGKALRGGEAEVGGARHPSRGRQGPLRTGRAACCLPTCPGRAADRVGVSSVLTFSFHRREAILSAALRSLPSSAPPSQG